MPRRRGTRHRKRTQHRRWVKSGLVNRLGRDKAQPALNLSTHHDAPQQRRAV
jgi:hypothetical protein